MHLVKSLLVLTSAAPLVVAGPRSHALRRRAGDDDKNSSFSSLTATDLAPSSSIPAKDQSSFILAGTAPLGTGISPASGTTQEIVITDVVYTTLTTCPITSLVTSGSTSFEEITTTISTVTRTSTSTLCTKCVAPPSKPAVSPTSSGETVSSVLSFIIIPSAQPSLTLPSISTSSVAEAHGTGGLPATLLINSTSVIPLQTAVTSKPEVSSTAASPSRSLIFPSFVSLTVSVTSGALSTLEFPGYGIVPSPTSNAGSPKGKITFNATSSIIPVFTAALLGNAYGGGFIRTPSVYVTKLPFPNGPSSGIPPGYGSQSSITVIENNVTAVLTGLVASSTSAAGLQNTTEIGIPAFTASITSNVSVLVSGLRASINSAASSEFESSTPTFVSLSPFGGRVVQESVSSAVPSLVSTEVSSSLGSATVGTETSVVSPGTASVVTGKPETSSASVITALVAATSPTGALYSEVSQVSNAVLSSLAAAGLPTSLVDVQVAVVGSSTTSVVGFSGETAESSFATPTLIGVAATQAPFSTISPLGAGTSTNEALTAAENAGSLATSATGLGDVIEASTVPPTAVAGVTLSPTFSSIGVNIEATSAGSLISGEVGANIILSLPTEESAGPVVTLAIGPLAEQTSAAGQPAVSTSTPNIVASSTVAFASTSSPVPGVNGQTLEAGQSAASLPTPILVATTSTGLAVVPSTIIPSTSTPSTVVPPTVIPSVSSIIVSSPVPGATSQTPAASQPATSLPTPILVPSTSTGLAVVPSTVIPSTIVPSTVIPSTVIPSTVIPSTVIPSTVIPSTVIPSPVVGPNSQTPAASQPAASLPAPIIVANGSTAIAVVPSPVVGANGLTSLAVFSTPIAPAAGLTTPAVFLTPIVGANGLTSLAVVATPVVGANGLTSLAIGFETETTPAAGQFNSAPTPVEGFVLVQSPAFAPQVSGGTTIQPNIAATGVSSVIVPSGSPDSPLSGGSGSGNYSIHVLLNPTAATHFQGSAVKHSFGFGVGFFGFIVFLVLL